MEPTPTSRSMSTLPASPPPPPSSPPAGVLAYADPPAPRRWLPRRPAPLWWRLSLTLACIYLPYAWLLVGGWPWRDYRLAWIKMWPILPGLAAGILVIPRTSNTAQFAAMGAMTVAGAGTFLLLAARSRRWAPIPSAIALALSAFNSWIAYAVYRA